MKSNTENDLIEMHQNWTAEFTKNLIEVGKSKPPPEKHEQSLLEENVEILQRDMYNALDRISDLEEEVNILKIYITKMRDDT